MPIYDYICATCGRRTEVMHGVHASGPEACPECGGGPMRKALHPPAIHFKGSGWAKKERAAAGARPSGDQTAPSTKHSPEPGAAPAPPTASSGAKGPADSATASNAASGPAESGPVEPAPVKTSEARGAR